MARLNIIDITGNTWNIDPISGNKLFSALLSYLKKKKPIEISFKDVQILTTHFLDSSISRLYNFDMFNVQWIEENVQFVEFETEYQKELVFRCIENAKKWYAERKNML